MSLRTLTRVQWRNALQVGFAGFVASSLYLALAPGLRMDDAFYILYGVARSLLPTPEASRKAASSRLIGTVFGGVVAFLLLLVFQHWLAIGIGYIIIKLISRWLNFNESIQINAVIMPVLLLVVPAYAQLGGTYVLYRTFWHLLGLMIGMLVERLFWYRSPLTQLLEAEENLRLTISSMLNSDSTVTIPVLIKASANLSILRAGVMRSADFTWLETVDSQSRHDCLESAVRHAVAMLRMPYPLCLVDARDCREALSSWPD